MAWCISTRASVATVLTMHPCVSRCLKVKELSNKVSDGCSGATSGKRGGTCGDHRRTALPATIGLLNPGLQNCGKVDIFLTFSTHFVSIPLSLTKLKGGYTGFTLSVHPFIRLSVHPSVHLCACVCGWNRTSYQATSKGVSCVKMLAKFEILAIVFTSVALTLSCFDRGFSECGRSSCSSFILVKETSRFLYTISAIVFTSVALTLSCFNRGFSECGRSSCSSFILVKETSRFLYKGGKYGQLQHAPPQNVIVTKVEHAVYLMNYVHNLFKKCLWSYLWWRHTLLQTLFD